MFFRRRGRGIRLARAVLAAGVWASLCVAAPETTIDEIAGQPPVAADWLPGLMKAVHRLVRHGESRPEGAWLGDRARRVVSMAVGDGVRPALRAVGRGRGVWRAVLDAASRLRGAGRGRGGRLLVRLDVAASPGPAAKVTIGLWRKALPGAHGVAFERKTGALLFPLDLVAGGVRAIHGRIDPRSLADALPRTLGASELRQNVLKFRPVIARRFSTLSAFTDGEQVKLLCAGRGVPQPVTTARLSEALALATEAFLRAVREDGSFIYHYDPVTGRESSDYNLPRHCGTLWALADLYAWGRDQRLRAMMRKAIRKLIEYRRPFGGAGGRAAALVRRDTVKLGSAALGVLALARCQEVTGDRQYEPLIRGLGRTLLLAQRKDGSFTCRYRYSTRKGDVNWSSIYYPGEAVYALTRLRALTGEAKWLQAAARGARYLIKVRDAGLKPAEWLHDHWLLLGLDGLCEQDPADKLWPERIGRLAAVIVNSQNRRPDAPWAFGAFGGRLRVTPAAVRTEGLLAAYRALKRAGRRAESERIFNAIGLSAGFQLRMQGRPESTFAFRRPAFLVGMFPAGVGEPDVRIDFLQHNVSGLIGLHKLMKSEARRSAPSPNTREALLLIRAAQRSVAGR